MDEFLNENIEENFQLLPDLLRSLEKERDSLQNQVNVAACSPRIIRTLVSKHILE